jgi:hypothetical protein
MKSLLANIVITESEWNYIQGISDLDVLKYLFELYEGETKIASNVDLAMFFETIRENIVEYDEQEMSGHEIFDVSDVASDKNAARVDVMIDNENLMIESDSLKALRLVTYKFVESGYILQRDLLVEKMFRKDKVTKYLRVFRIVDQSTGLCFN